MRCKFGLVDRGDGETMSLIQQVWSVRVAEVELIIEIIAVRHNILGKSVGGLERQTAPESSLALHEECVVVVYARADQGIELSGISGLVASLGQQVRIQIRQYDRASGARARVGGSWSAEDVSSGTGRRVQVQIVCTGRSQVDSVRPGCADRDDGVTQNLTLNLQAPLQDVRNAEMGIHQ